MTIPPDVLSGVISYVTARVRAPIGTDRDDVLQDARLIACRRWAEGYRSSRLYKRTWGDLKDRYGTAWSRHYRGKPGPSVPLFPAAAVVPDHAESIDLAVDVRDALAKLTAPQRDVVEGFLSGLSQEDIARKRGTTVTAVKKMFRRARETLKVLLGEYA